MRSVRTVVRTLIAGFLALAGPALAAPAVPAHAQEIQQQSSRTDSSASRQLTLSIDGVSPNFAIPASTVRVSGTLTNHTGSAITSAAIQLLTYPQVFFTRSDMDNFARGHGALFLQQAGTPGVTGRVANGATVRWTVSFRPALAGYGGFGVYPVEVVASAAGSGYQATGRTLLPFWPEKDAAKPLDTAWIWPLIDRPQQGPCSQTLATNSLAASLGAAGRLGTLLAAGQRWAERDRLTWAIDPALLSDANVMTHRYKVGGSSECTGAKHMPASAAAIGWLSTLRDETTGQSVLLTPYADADASALTHAGMDQNLRTAYRLGKSVAGKILPPPFGITETGTGDGGAAAIAWPADGMADASVATSLASNGGIRTLVLNSGGQRVAVTDQRGSVAAPGGAVQPRRGSWPRRHPAGPAGHSGQPGRTQRRLPGPGQCGRLERRAVQGPALPAEREPAGLTRRGGRGHHLHRMARPWRGRRLAGAWQARELPVRRRGEGADHHRQEDPAGRGFRGHSGVGAEPSAAASSGQGGGDGAGRQPGLGGQVRQPAAGPADEDGHRTDAGALHRHRDHHHAATVGNEERVTADLDRAVAERPGDAVRAGTARAHRRRARGARADLRGTVGPPVAARRQGRRQNRRQIWRHRMSRPPRPPGLPPPDDDPPPPQPRFTPRQAPPQPHPPGQGQPTSGPQEPPAPQGQPTPGEP